MKDHLKPRGLMLAPAAVVLASGGGVAYATSSHSADSTIHGCYSQSNRKIVSLNYATTLSSATTMNFNCQITAGDAAKADEVFFTAIKVGSVTQQ